MHLEALFDQLLDFSAEYGIVISDLIRETGDDYLSLMLPEQVLLTDQELEQF